MANVVKIQQRANKEPVLVTQPYIPSIEKYMHYVQQAFDNKWLTNDGPLVKELTARLKDYLNVEHLLLVSNGTSALQLAYRVKDLNGKVAATTPFTFPATSTALEWNNTTIKLADVDKNSWNLNPNSVRQLSKREKLDAIVPVNIFGMPCDLDGFDKLGQELDVPVIYDSAQSLLSTYKGKPIFDYGDIHCVSFHATKLFHSVEGGAVIFKDKNDFERAKRLINFGIAEGGEVRDPGINAKMSELHAAMGLCVLDDLPLLVENREKSVRRYHKALEGCVELQHCDYEHYCPPMYMPIKMETEQQLKRVEKNLVASGYLSRRYFHPKNNRFIKNTPRELLPVSDSACHKILCLPLMHNLDKKHINHIASIVKRSV